MNIPILRIKDENGQYQDIPAIKGAKGDKGDPGTNGVDGGYYKPSVSSSGDLSWTPSKSGMPDVATSNIKGPQGEQGPTGQTGPKGDTPNVTVGTTTTSDPGGDASVTKNSSSTEDNAIFDFVIPRGEQGPQGNPGSDGKSPTVNVGTTTTGPAGSQASVTNSGTETDAVFNFTIPVGIQGQRGEKGDTGSVFTPSVDADGIISWTNNGGLENPPSQDIKGPQGDKGDSATITIGTTTTGNEGTNASVTNTGTSSDAVFNFTIPRGNTGAQGEAATINVGTTETISPGTSAEVSNSGTSSNAVFNFKIPRGEKGDTGDTGATPSINVGTTTTGNPGTEASVTKDKSSTETNVIFDFTIPRGDKGETGEQGIKGDKGDTGVTFTPSVSQDGIISWTNDGDLKNPSSVDIKGDKGDAATVSIGSTVTTEPGTSASVTNTGTSNDAIFNFSIPKGEKGDKGETGSVGPQGPTGPTGATFTPSVSGEGIISWTNDKGLDNPSSVDIKGPQGDRGPQGETGPDGKAATISVGTTTSGDPGEQASVTNSGTSSDAVFNFVIPRGEQGTPGNDGITPEISAGKTVTGNPGTSASVVKDSTSTESNVIFNFTIPRGDKGEQGNPGPQGQSATIEVGNTVTGQPGSQASVTNSGTSSAAVFNFTIPEGQKGNPGNDGEKGDPGAVFTPSVSDEGIISWTNNGDLPNPTSVNIRGPQGIQGSKGDAATVSVGETTTVDPGTEASVTNSGTSSAAVFNFSIPKGEKGDQGIQGNKGDPGEAATIEIGTTTTGLPGSQASVTNSGTSEKAVFNFSIPKGEKGNTGDTGPRGEAATVSVGTTTTGDPGGSASVTNSGTSSDAVFNFVIPRGQQGTPGQDGITPTISAGTTTTGDAGTNASVTKDPSSTESEAVFNFTIPRGDKGDTGETGPQGSAATVSIGTTTTGNPGTSASVTNSGTSSEAVFNFTIPKGDTGSPGAKGDTGAVFTPSVSSEGIISWTNNGGLQNPSSVNIKGPKGDNGSPGSPGSSATITVGSTTTSDPGTSASVTNSGTSSAAIFNFTIPKGEKGDPGDNGLNGENGGYYQPSVSSGGDLSWTPTDPNMPSVSSVNIKGPQGDQGLQGPQGIQGVPGADGVDGISPTVSVGTTTTGQAGSQAIVQNSGTETDVVLDFTIPRGIQGDKGDNGSTFTPSVSESGIISWTNDGGLPNPSPQNIRGPQGQNGSPGLYVGNSAPSDANIRLWVKPVDDYVFSYSNPNLLINSNFLDPINQRGENTYTGSSYGFDRWKGDTVGTTILVSGGGILVTGSMSQYVEMKSMYIGETFTLSSCDANGNIKYITGELSGSSVSGNDMSFQYIASSPGSIKVSLSGGNRYRWAKLEIGGSPTLYTPRSRAEEMVLCLRYYWRIQQTNSDFNYFGGGIANAASNTYFTINLPVYMRDFPELGYGGNFQCYGGNGNFPIGSLAESPFTSTTDPIDDQTSTYTLVAVRNGGSQTAGHVYNLNGTTPGSYIEFDSEIY